MSQRVMMSAVREYDLCACPALAHYYLGACESPGLAMREAERIMDVGEVRTEDADYHVLPTMLWPAELPVPQAQLRARPFHVAKVLANRAADRGVFVLQPEDARILAEALAQFIEAEV